MGSGKRSHGGPRPRSGRPKELEKPQKVLVTLEQTHLRLLAEYAKQHKLGGRSAALRWILDKLFKIRRAGK